MRTLKCILCIMLIGTALSSCGAVSQMKSGAKEVASKEQITVTSVSVSSPEESVSAKSVRASVEKENEMKMVLQIGKTTFFVQLEDNETAAAFAELLPMTITMQELNGNEKYFHLDNVLPTNSKVPDGIEAGDVMLYGSDCLVVFYESFSTTYSYTPLGHITDTEGLKDVLGSSSVSVEWSRE